MRPKPYSCNIILKERLGAIENIDSGGAEVGQCAWYTTCENMKKRLAYNLATYIKMGDGPVPVFLISFKRSEVLSHFVILLPC